MAGAALLASKSRYSKWGWISFIIGQCCYVPIGLHNHNYWLVGMNVWFFFVDWYGFYKYTRNDYSHIDTYSTEVLYDSFTKSNN